MHSGLRRLIGVAFLVVLALGAVGLSAWRLFGRSGQPASANAGGAGAQADQPTAPKAATFGRTTALLLGTDDRRGSIGRSDTVMIGVMDPAARAMAILSLPRDLLVEIPGHGYDKLAHAYAYGVERGLAKKPQDPHGGEKLVLETVQQLLDIPVDHYAVVNFQGFRAIVDALGGIDIEVKKRMYYEDPYDDNGGLVIDFYPGLQHLDGEQALKYARFRSDEEGDFGRMHRQQEVIEAALDKALSPGVVLRLPALVTALVDTVRTDLSLTQMLQFTSVGKEVAANAKLQTTVVQGENRFYRGVSYVVADLPALRRNAYRLLLGQEPTDAYLRQAEADQAAMQAVIARWAEEDRRQAQAAKAAAAKGTDANGAEGVGAGGDGGSAPPGQPAAPGQATAPGQPAAPGGTEGEPGTAADPEPRAGASGPTSGDPRRDTAEPAPVQVSLTDASGRGLLTSYVTLISQNGFTVGSATPAGVVQPGTLILDRSGDPAVQARLRQLFPWARIQAEEPGGGPAVSVVLGADAP